jgi:hypothetical protein
LVPDISSDADPATGVYIVYDGSTTSTCPSPPPPRNPCAVAGTSLAAPTQAGLYTNELIAHGFATGLGDIHARMYAAAATAGAFTDITTGTTVDPSTGNGFAAGPGYDEATGLGTPNWDNLINLIDVDPGAVAAVTGTNGHVYLHRSGVRGFSFLGGTTASAPSVVSWHGTTYLLAAGTNHQLYVRTLTQGWRQLTNYSLNCIDPAANIEEVGTRGVGFIAGCLNPANHHIYLGYTPLRDDSLPLISKGSVGAFGSLGGIATSGPALVEYDLNLVVQATGGSSGTTVYQNIPTLSQTGRIGPGAWTGLPFSCYDKPALAADGAVLWLACDGSGHALWLAVRQLGHPWSRAIRLGGLLVAAPGLALGQGHVLTAFVESASHSLYQKVLAPSPGAWVKDGGLLNYGASATELSG